MFYLRIDSIRHTMIPVFDGDTHLKGPWTVFLFVRYAKMC